MKELKGEQMKLKKTELLTDIKGEEIESIIIHQEEDLFEIVVLIKKDLEQHRYLVIEKFDGKVFTTDYGLITENIKNDYLEIIEKEF